MDEFKINMDEFNINMDEFTTMYQIAELVHSREADSLPDVYPSASTAMRLYICQNIRYA